MSFGCSASDAILLVQLAWRTVQNSRKACGEHDELTREVLSLHVTLRRLQQEVERPENQINKPDDTYKKELEVIVEGCQKVLRQLDIILEKYNTLAESERSGRKLWKQVRFGNGEMVVVRDLRGKITYYTSAMSLCFNMVSVGSVGRVEKQMDEHGGYLRDIKFAVNDITARSLSKSHQEGSTLTAYADDDRSVWKQL